MIMIGIGVLTLVVACFQHRVQMRRLNEFYPDAPFSLALLLAPGARAQAVVDVELTDEGERRHRDLGLLHGEPSRALAQEGVVGVFGSASRFAVVLKDGQILGSKVLCPE